MSRSVSAAFKEAVFAQETGEAFLLLITVSHPDIESPFRVVATGGENITSRGELFVYLPVEVDLPGDMDDAQPQASIRIDNIERDVILALRSIRSAPTILVEIVRDTDPDEVEISLPVFELRDVDYDAIQIAGRLEVQDLSSEPFPCDLFTPALFPGVF